MQKSKCNLFLYSLLVVNCLCNYYLNFIYWYLFICYLYLLFFSPFLRPSALPFCRPLHPLWCHKTSFPCCDPQGLSVGLELVPWTCSDCPDASGAADLQPAGFLHSPTWHARTPDGFLSLCVTLIYYWLCDKCKLAWTEESPHLSQQRSS